MLQLLPLLHCLHSTKKDPSLKWMLTLFATTQTNRSTVLPMCTKTSGFAALVSVTKSSETNNSLVSPREIRILGRQFKTSI